VSTQRLPGGSPSGVTYQSVLDGDLDHRDTVAPPSVLRAVSEPWADGPPVALDRYTSQAFAELEAEHLWGHSWQMACRLEHLPEVGDHLLYEVAGLSIIVVRSGPDRIQAFHNSCLHRGTTLVEGRGNAAMFKCPFHGFAWSIDGTFRGMPASWDFPHADPDTLALPEAAVALWHGFVFVHPDPDPEPFEAFAAPLSEHFAQHPLDGRYVAHHACQVVAANWKTVMEAFLEGYHLSTTHHHTVRFANDFEIQYDCFGDNVSRLVQAIGIPTSALIGKVPPEEIAATVQRMLPSADRAEVPDGVDVRAFLAERFRASFARRWQVDLSTASTAELLDSIQYFLFPNFAPWMGYSLPIVYRFRPWGDDVGHSLMEIMLLHPVPPDGGHRTAEPHWLAEGESWSHAPGFEALGMVIDQDMANLPRVQRGMVAARHRTHLLADYQESRLRHFHARLDRQLGLAP